MLMDPKARWVRMMLTKYVAAGEAINILWIMNLPKRSQILNFILKCGNLIADFVSWDVHDGTSCLLWEDSWVGCSSIDSLISIPTTRQWLRLHWGIHIRDYANFSMENSFLGWSWKKMEGLPLPSNELNQLFELIKDTQLFFR